MPDNNARSTASPVTKPKSDFDAIPTLAYAITAFKRSGGKPGNKFWDSYAQAVSHVASTYGKEAAEHLQEVAQSTARSNGDLSDSLHSYSKGAIASNRPINPVVKNLLAMASDGQKPLDKFTYAFDLPETPVAQSPVMASIRNVLKK